uniref:tRNA(Ile2) 2-agmatinylcytidine synthetase TiaS n=1 Tax=Myoviridae sp. ctt8G1 TaxID=2827713 RepID=A0A8S5THE1_9CAUD|nr:MAG TPA: tRNA(Ile2) 2-agmatinylcytidine synthetase TiaS [Myoviridae sp. ctt8G1]
MKAIEMNQSAHEWEKKNLVTLWAKTRGGYDVYRCKHCGIEGRSYKLGIIEIPERYAGCVDTCNRRHLSKSLKVTHCGAVGKAFSNLTDGSIHTIITPPEGESNQSGEWVMGDGEPVLLLWHEFQYI